MGASPSITQQDVVRELYNRIGTLPADKAAIVSELARRFNVSANSPQDPNYVPDAAARAAATNRAMASQAIDSADNFQMPAHPYGGAPLLTVNPHAVDAAVPAALRPVQDLALGPMHGAGNMLDGAARIANAHSARDVAGGAHQVISGGLETVTPSLGYAGIAAPVATAAGLAGGNVAQKGATAALKAAGTPDEYADLAGDAAGVLGGSAAAHYGPGAVAGAAGAVRNLPSKIVLPRSGTPVQQAAVDWALQQGAPLDAAAATLNPLVRGAQEVARTTIGAGTAAERAIGARQDWYAQKGADLAQQVSPSPATPESAGRAVADQGDATIKAANAKANAAYANYRAYELDPANAREVQTGTKTETRQMPTGEMDANGAPVTQAISRQVPVIENVPVPVDMRPFKDQFTPVLQQIDRLTRLGQQQYAPMQVALEDLVNGPDFKPASAAEQDLAAIKDVSRKNTLTGGVKNDAGALAANAIPKLQGAIDDAVGSIAGPDALAHLQQGRIETAGKYGAIDLVDQFRQEPVKLYQQLTASKDGAIDLLRKVNQLAPDQTPQLGRAWLDAALSKATESGGFNHAAKLFSDWQNLGDATKQIIFKNPALVSDLDNFFQSAKDSAAVENTSGTARVAHLSGQGTLLAMHPVSGTAYLIGGNAISRLLYNPRFVRAAIRAMDTPVNSAGGPVAAQSLLAAAASAGAPAAGSPSAASPAAAAPAVTAPAPAASPDTVVKVPGEPNNAYKAQYALKELGDLQASHSGQTFQPNPKYALANDRDYNNAVNQGKVIGWSSRSEFDPTFLISDHNDATAGPLVTDAQGNVLGGNGRKMILDRVYSGNPEGAAAYRALLEQKAPQFGLDAKQLEGMKQPVLVRQIPDSEFAPGGRSKQDAVSDFNKRGTAELTPSERAVSEARRVSPATLDHIAAQLEKGGVDSTVREALEGQAGKEVLNRIIQDGAITNQERAALETKEGLTDAGKDRIEKLLAVRYIGDLDTVDNLAPAVRNKVTRLAAPLAQIETRGVNWNLAPAVRDAVELLFRAQTAGVKNVDDFIQQDGLFGAQKYSDTAQELARGLQRLNGSELVGALRQYAQDSNFAAGGASLFGGNPTPDSSLADALKAAYDKNAAAKSARAEAKNANALASGKNAGAGKPKNSLSK